MALLIRKGTRVIVRKPTGQTVVHACKDDGLFHDREQVGEHRTLQFKRSDFVLSVSALDVTEVRYRCPQCGRDEGIQGLCDACRRKWIPPR